MELTHESAPFDVTMELAGGSEGRWEVQVEIRPESPELFLNGATLVLLDGDGKHQGPMVVLPLQGLVPEHVSLTVTVRGPERLHGHTLLRLTAFLQGYSAPVQVDQWVGEQRGFHAFLMGGQLLDPGPPRAGRSLTPAEQERLCTGFPWLSESIGPDTAFSAFKEDLLSSMDLGEDDEVTEEILRMLQEG